MNKNSKRNGRPRDEKGRFVSLSAIYSVKHNTVDLEKFYEEKMKFWGSEGLKISSLFIRPFEYRTEAFRIPDNYKYTKNEVLKFLDGPYNYVLEMSDMVEANLAEPEKILSVAKLVNPKDATLDRLYFKNALWKNEGMTLVPLAYLNKDTDFYVPFTSEPKDVEMLFQGVIAKKKLKDLVVDTYYKLDFNKCIRTHYTLTSKIDEDSPVYVCRYYNSPISIYGYDEVSAVIFKKTDFDEDGDRIILTIPEPVAVLIKQDYGFLVIDLIDKNIQPYPIDKLDELINLVPNLMIPEGILRLFSRDEIIRNQSVKPTIQQPTPRGEFDIPDGVRVNVKEKYPITITLLNENGTPKEHIIAYRLGEFRAPRKDGNYETIVNVKIKDKEYCYATAPKDLWILIDKNVDKIYFYSVYYNRVIDWCFAATFDFLNLLNRFSSEFLSNDVKEELLKKMNDIRLNYYSQYEDITTDNEGLTGFLESL